MKQLILWLLVNVVVSASSYAADNVVSPTRLVVVFSQLAEELDVAAKHADAGVVEKLLAPNFEMRIGTMPGNPVPRATWLRQMQTDPDAKLALTQMAVHDLGSVAVVSYLNKRAASKDDVYIVDVWKKQDLNWQLAVRYASPAGRADFVIPGAALNAPVLDKRF